MRCAVVWFCRSCSCCASSRAACSRDLAVAMRSSSCSPSACRAHHDGVSRPLRESPPSAARSCSAEAAAPSASPGRRPLSWCAAAAIDRSIARCPLLHPLLPRLVVDAALAGSFDSRPRGRLASAAQQRRSSARVLAVVAASGCSSGERRAAVPGFHRQPPRERGSPAAAAASSEQQVDPVARPEWMDRAGLWSSDCDHAWTGRKERKWSAGE